MKLVITVTDGQISASDEEAGTAVSAKKSSDQDGQVVEVIDAGAVPEALLSMESQVAAGHAPMPGRLN